jgi:hypothetical protein
MTPFLYFIEFAETPKIIWAESEEKAIEELLKKFDEIEPVYFQGRNGIVRLKSTNQNID